MTDIAIIGEVMVELASLGDKKYSLGAAGDTYNTACTLQGLGIDVVYLTSIGTGQAANAIREHAAEYEVGLLEPADEPSRSPGLYMITNDDSGERSFDYWRNDSAAKALFSDSKALSALLQQVVKVGYCYFSGITLAIMSSECRALLLDYLAWYRRKGGKVIFDPNYRPALWDTQDMAANEMSVFRQQVDIYLPGFEEEERLFGATSVTSAAIQLMDAGVNEGVIKNGAESCTLVSRKTINQIRITPARSVLDTTGAGDSFNGGYIGARISGLKPDAAVTFAAVVAAKVLAVRGGVLQQKQMSGLKTQLLNILT